MSTIGLGLDTVIGGQEIKRDAAVAKQHFDLAIKAEGAGNHDGALAELRKAVAADPGDQRALFKLALLLDMSGEDEEAIGFYEQIVEHPPAPINALLNLATLYEDRGEFAKAERCLKQVLDTDANHPRARLFMLDVQASKGMIKEDDGEKDRFKRSALLDTPVTDFELSVRARTCLKKMSIRTLGDLIKTTEAELLSYKNFGDNSLVEIKQMLAAKGLKLGQGRDEAHRAVRKQMIDQYKGTAQEGILQKAVSELNLSVRARKALQLLNIHTLGELIAHTEAELLGVKNFGATSLAEVRQKLNEFGLLLRKIDA
jgi:DNA-directed RNA polymerase subunit alpha